MEDLGRDGKIRSQQISEKQDMKVRTRVNWSMTGSNGRLL